MKTREIGHSFFNNVCTKFQAALEKWRQNQRNAPLPKNLYFLSETSAFPTNNKIPYCTFYLIFFFAKNILEYSEQATLFSLELGNGLHHCIFIQRFGNGLFLDGAL